MHDDMGIHGRLDTHRYIIQTDLNCCCFVKRAISHYDYTFGIQFIAFNDSEKNAKRIPSFDHHLYDENST